MEYYNIDTSVYYYLLCSDGKMVYQTINRNIEEYLKKS